MSQVKYKEKPCGSNKHLNLSSDITPEILRTLADKMESNNVISFRFPYYYGTSCIEKRPETPAEERARINKEQEKKIAEFKRIEKKKKDLITQAKKLGLVLQEERCMNE
jgi:hypothetical protein